MLFIITAVTVAVIVTVIILVIAGRRRGSFLSPEKRAGRRGERAVSDIIRSVLRDDDYLFTNVKISFEGRRTELDNVIVSRYGVFIIEVKSYKGRLDGGEDDDEWYKYKDDGYGNTFVKKVRNPVPQVRRQIYILAKYLEYNGIRVWIMGFVMFLYNNSPVKSSCVLESPEDIDSAIHTYGRKKLDRKMVDRICRILQDI